jgi:hypothetical protein
MRADDRNALLVQLAGMTISAKGKLAVCVISIAVALLLAALAWRTVGGNLRPVEPADKGRSPPNVLLGESPDADSDQRGASPHLTHKNSSHRARSALAE